MNARVFQVTIELGNDAMLTGEDVAEALHGVADRIAEVYTVLPEQDAIPLRDVNGNPVGHWSVGGQS